MKTLKRALIALLLCLPLAMVLAGSAVFCSAQNAGNDGTPTFGAQWSRGDDVIDLVSLTPEVVVPVLSWFDLALMVTLRL
jgi:hypothetical protein